MHLTAHHTTPNVYQITKSNTQTTHELD